MSRIWQFESLQYAIQYEKNFIFHLFQITRTYQESNFSGLRGSEIHEAQAEKTKFTKQSNWLRNMKKKV